MLIGGTASVHNQSGASHKGRVVRGQEKNGFGNFVGGSHSPHGPVGGTGQVGVPLQASKIRVFGKHRRVHVAWTDAIYADALTAVVDRHGFCEQNHAAFGGALGDSLV